ncbi:Hypothetical protein NTJ_07076 [Nesidiocoris tenuis]|uniref:Uncharacterized protein n=1 Tax=Nesidiocoris tenuis TaxID=355587 RepID=A0ABN7AUY1_9HEMI|nr:Hypothetical protein NTJ_07076 [Nesidiocoris tenuis]
MRLPARQVIPYRILLSSHVITLAPSPSMCSSDRSFGDGGRQNLITKPVFKENVLLKRLFRYGAARLLTNDVNWTSDEGF